MGVTTFESLNAEGARVKLQSYLDLLPTGFYGSDNQVFVTDWIGGELTYHTGENRLYIQRATSGTTAKWRQLSEAFIDYP